MAMEQQRWPTTQHHWSSWVEAGKELTVATGRNERLYVTGVSLVAYHGAADVCAVVGRSSCVPLATLSGANPCAPASLVVYEQEGCSFFVMPQGGGESDEAGARPVIVQFDGCVVAVPPVVEAAATPPVDSEGNWYMQLESGDERRFAPRAGAPVCVTAVTFRGAAAHGGGVVDAGVVIGGTRLLLASLSEKTPRVESPRPLVLDEEFSFYVMQSGGEPTPWAIVQFEGYVLALTSPPVEEEEEEEEEWEWEEEENGDYDYEYDKYAGAPVEDEGEWYVRLETGGEARFTPRPSAPMCVTAVLLPGPADAGGGAVDACVVIGSAQCRLLAMLSEERPRVELQPPLVLDKDFCFQAMRPGLQTGRPNAIVHFEGCILHPSAPEEEDDNGETGSSSEYDGEVEELAATASDDCEDYDGEEEGLADTTSDDEEDKALLSSEEDDEGYEEEIDGEVGGHAATERSAGGGNGSTLVHRWNFVAEAVGRFLGGLARRFAVDAELVQEVAIGALIGFCVFAYLVTFFKVMAMSHQCA